MNKHFKVEGELSYADGNQNDGNNAHLVGWDLRAEWQFGQTMPVSLFASYDGLYSRNDSFPNSGGTITESQVNVGFRFLFGTVDPLDNDRNGTPVDLPNFPHWVHQAGEAVE